MTDYSVIVPAYNAARTIEEALRSALAQTVPAAEIVVVDDGSTDDTASIATELADDSGGIITVVMQPNGGPAAATDSALALVDTEFVAGLDADDVWQPGKAAAQLARLAQRPDLDAVFCRAFVFHHGRQPAPDAPVQELWGRTAMLMRTEAARRIGPVADPAEPDLYGEMIRWFDRGRRLGLTFEMMPDVLAGRRIIAGSLSYQRNPADFLPLLRQRLRERRGPSGA